MFSIVVEMQDMTSDKPRKYRSKGYLADRYDVCERTIDRWYGVGKLPPPDIVLPNGAPRWFDDTIEAHERGLVGKSAA
jgi:hypothetical protein